MTALLPPWPMFSAFIVASLVLAITPGPGVLYIVTRGLAQGRRHGLASVVGVAVGNFGNALAASLGLAAVFALSSVAFAVVKYAGALYLVYLGVRLLQSPSAARPPALPRPEPLRRVCRDGFLVALLNPKTTVFFAAFLPQFMSAGASPMLQCVALSAIFVAIAAVTDTAYAVAAGAGAALLRRSAGRSAARLGGGALIGLGLFTALSAARPPRP